MAHLSLLHLPVNGPSRHVSTKLLLNTDCLLFQARFLLLRVLILKTNMNARIPANKRYSAFIYKPFT